MVALVVIGSHYEAGKTTPLYAIEFGDTSRPERQAEYYAPAFGPYAIDGTVYTRRGSRCHATTWTRPQTLTQATRWLRSPETFRHTTRSKCMDKLIDYAVRYRDGSAKLYLRPMTSQRQAAKIDREMRTR